MVKEGPCYHNLSMKYARNSKDLYVYGIWVVKNQLICRTIDKSCDVILFTWWSSWNQAWNNPMDQEVIRSWQCSPMSTILHPFWNVQKYVQGFQYAWYFELYFNNCTLHCWICQILLNFHVVGFCMMLMIGVSFHARS